MSKFSDDVIEFAFDRQGRLCAACGKTLSYENYEKGDRGAWHAHHIDRDHNNDHPDNCACLCVNDPNCHLSYAHGGDTKGIYLTPIWAYMFLEAGVHPKERRFSYPMRREILVQIY